MIQTEILTKKVETYRFNCFQHGLRPSYKGLGNVLGISTTTVWNVSRGTFNGTAYTDKPSASRCIANDDFGVIQDLFGLPVKGNS